jgi:hypothetical protein
MTTQGKCGRAAITGLALAVALLWCSLGVAWAGGPTSVIMVNPQAGTAAALHTSDDRYEQLVEAVGAYRTPTGTQARPAGVTDCSGCEIRLTWLIHDMQIWRIDRVHLTSGDGIWLETVADESGGDVLARPAVWHRPSDPETLVGLLTATAVTTTSPRDDIPGSADRSELATTAGRPTPLVGLIAGAGVGLVAGLAVVWLAWRRRPDRDRAVLTG